MRGESRRVLVGSGVPGVLQSTMQHICAAMLSGVPSAARAASQQPGIEQPCSAECAGTPAKTLPPTAAKRTKDISRFTIIGSGDDDSNESQRCLSRRRTHRIAPDSYC